MRTALIHFAAGTVGALAIFLLFMRLSRTPGFSAPFGVVFIGIACASLAHYVSPWATPAVLAIYAIATAREFMQERKAESSGQPPNAGQ